MGGNDVDLFAWLRANPKFVAWVDAQERAALTVLKTNPTDVHLHRAQGECRLIDRMRELMSASEKRAR